MFPTYVLTAAKRPVDFQRAKHLMDKDLLQLSIDAMERERTESPRWDARYGPQWIWDFYCQRHLEKYGTYFEPDVSKTWE